mgnify:CR=1 FL=1
MTVNSIDNLVGEVFDTPAPPRCARVAAGLGQRLGPQWWRAIAGEQRSSLPGALRRASPVQACPPRERCALLLLVCPTPGVCAGWDNNFFKEDRMNQDADSITVRPSRPVKSSRPAKPYRAPRYRVALVCEDSGASSAAPIQSSTVAGAVLRPCFDGLDREQFLICGLDAKHGPVSYTHLTLPTSDLV